MTVAGTPGKGVYKHLEGLAVPASFEEQKVAEACSLLYEWVNPASAKTMDAKGFWEMCLPRFTVALSWHLLKDLELRKDEEIKKHLHLVIDAFYWQLVKFVVYKEVPESIENQPRQKQEAYLKQLFAAVGHIRKHDKKFVGKYLSKLREALEKDYPEECASFKRIWEGGA